MRKGGAEGVESALDAHHEGKGTNTCHATPTALLTFCRRTCRRLKDSR